MAPEMITNALKEGDNSYDSRIDVWALGKLATSIIRDVLPQYGIEFLQFVFIQAE